VCGDGRPSNPLERLYDRHVRKEIVRRDAVEPAELLRRHHDAAWRVDDGELVLAVEGPVGATAFEPDVVAIACFAGESSFVDAYAHVAAEAGLEPPLGG
jgi:hypothetical protein